jgi:hypothetical protein
MDRIYGLIATLNGLGPGDWLTLYVLVVLIVFYCVWVGWKVGRS